MYIDSGIPEINDILDAAGCEGGWPRGRIIEMSGSSLLGKKWILSKTCDGALNSNGKILNYEILEIYNKKLIEKYGFSIPLFRIDNDIYKEILAEIEQFCLSNKYDIIEVRLFQQLFMQMFNGYNVEDQIFLSNLINRWIPRINSAIRKSKTVLFFVNEGQKKNIGERAIKFYSYIKLNVCPYNLPNVNDSCGIRVRIDNRTHLPTLECLILGEMDKNNFVKKSLVEA
jgi:hypothetical protein